MTGSADSFRAEQLPDPHGDEDQAGRWPAGPGDTAASLIAALRHLDVAREVIGGTTGELPGVDGRRHPTRGRPAGTGRSRIMIT